MTPLSRIVSERRALVVPLVVAALLNVAVYMFVVYPLSLRVAGTEQRAGTVRGQLAAAERDASGVRATLAAREKADVALAKFYSEILPADVAGARRISYARLAQLADAAGLLYERRNYEVDTNYRGALNRLRITMVLSGTYDDVREFIYELEKAPEFLVVEDIALVEGAKEGSPLTLTLRLATYFTGRDGDGDAD